jgi:AcrR family transcriptional regulator
LRINDRTYLLRQNEQLFIATLEEFSSKCYDLASTNEIIKKSDYNKGSFYYRFKMKDDIYFALIDFVYTTQVALFNDQNLKLSNLNTLEDVIRCMFEQLRQLYVIDKRYIALLNTIYRESKEFNDYIKQNCVESQLERFLMRLEIILRKTMSQDETETFLDLVTFAYHNPNINFENNYNVYVDSLIKFLVDGYKESEVVTNKSNFSLDELKDNLTIILAKYGTLSVDKAENHLFISSYITNEHEVLKEIKTKLKIQKVTLGNIIRAGTLLAEREFDHLLDLLGLDYSEISFNSLTNLQKNILYLTYAVLEKIEIIILDYQLKFIYQNDTKILLKSILPILSKTSKIVLLEEVIDLIPSIYKNTYYIDNSGKMKKVQSYDIPIDFSKDIVIDYYDEDGNLKTEFYARNNPLILDYLKKHKVIDINTFTRISIDDLI